MLPPGYYRQQHHNLSALEIALLLAMIVEMTQEPAKNLSLPPKVPAFTPFFPEIQTAIPKFGAGLVLHKSTM